MEHSDQEKTKSQDVRYKTTELPENKALLMSLRS